MALDNFGKKRLIFSLLCRPAQQAENQEPQNYLQPCSFFGYFLCIKTKKVTGVTLLYHLLLPVSFINNLHLRQFLADPVNASDQIFIYLFSKCSNNPSNASSIEVIRSVSLRLIPVLESKRERIPMRISERSSI